MKIVFIGIGNVGFALANRLQQKGHEITVATEDTGSETVQKALAQNPNFLVMKLQQAVDECEVVFFGHTFSGE